MDDINFHKFILHFMGNKVVAVVATVIMTSVTKNGKSASESVFLPLFCVCGFFRAMCGE